MSQSTLFATLLGAMLAAACSYALGLLFASLLSVRLTRLEGHLFRFLTGSAALSTITFGLCTIHQAKKGVFVAITVIAALLALRHKPQVLESERPSGLGKAQWLCGAAIYLYFALIYLVNAIAPEFSPDGATYHLGNVARWWRLFGFDDYAGSIYSMWSQGFEMLFLVAFSIGKHPAAAVVHCLFGLLLPALIYSYGRRIGRGWIFAAAGLMIFASPVVGRTASTAYNDISVACLLFACFYLIEIWREDQQPALLAACGWLAGFAFAVKFTAIPALLYGLAIILWQSPKQTRLRHVALLVGFAIPTAAPWLVRNAIVYGNPFAPFLNRIFENPYVSAPFEAEYAAAMSLYPELHSRWQLPWNWAVEGHAVGGIFGPWILLLPLALLAIRDSLVQRLLLTAAMMGWPVMLNCGTRFLLPALLFATPAMLIGLQRLGIPPLMVLALHAILCIPRIVPLYAGPHVWRLEEVPWRAALRLEPEEAFLGRKMGALPIAIEMERRIPLNARTFSNTQLPLAYTTRRVWHNWQSLEAVTAHQVLLYALNPMGENSIRTRFEFAAQNVNGLRIVADAESGGPWRVSELTPSGERQTARPYRWGAWLAADGNLATSWSTIVPLRKGDFLELTFAAPTSVDSVEVISGGMPNEGQWHIEAQDASGKWGKLRSAMKQSLHEPVLNARQESVRALRALGFSYLVIRPEDDLGRDLLNHPADWNLSVVSRIGDAAILEIP